MVRCLSELLGSIRRMGALYSVTEDDIFRAPGVKPVAYEVFGFPRWMLKDIDDTLREDANADAPTLADYKAVLDDKRRLIRELDVALHGEEGAAEQASLCDLIAPAEKLRAEVTRLERVLEKELLAGLQMQVQLNSATKVVDNLSRHGLLTQIKLDNVNIENDALRAVLEKVLVGGNHLALHIDADAPSYKVDFESALEYFGDDGVAYDAWVCWATIMNTRDTLDVFKKLKKEGGT